MSAEHCALCQGPCRYRLPPKIGWVWGEQSFVRAALGFLGGLVVLWAIVVSLWFMLMTLTAPKAHAQSWPDGATITAAADSAGISRHAALAIAWEETADNIDPKVRGHACWYMVPAHWDKWGWNTSMAWFGDSTLVPRHTHHEKDCEVGRFQIKPSTARRRCPGLDVFTYDGNLACFTRMFKEDTDTSGTLSAIVHHNGRGPKAQEYLNRVLKTVGRLALTEET